jgi:hypothetical protein
MLIYEKERCLLEDLTVALIIIVKRKINILEISSRSDIGGGPEQLFKIVANIEDSFRFYCACPDQEPYFAKITSEGIPVFKLPHRRFEIKSFFRLLRWTGKQDQCCSLTW